MGFVQRRVLTMVLGVVARPKLTLAIAGIVLAGCVVLAWTRLSVSTDQNKLFAPQVGFFNDYLRFVRQFPENEALYVLVEPVRPGAEPPVDHWTTLADQITARLRAMPSVVRLVESRVNPQALGVYGFIFEENPQLRDENFRQFTQFAQLLKRLAERPGLDWLILGRSPIERLLAMMQQAATADPPGLRESAGFVAAVSDSLIRTLQQPQVPPAQLMPDFTALDASTPRRLGYFYEPDRSDATGQSSVLLVRVYPRTNYTSLTAVSHTVEQIRAAVQDVARLFPEFKVGITGRPALEADEMRTTDIDTNRAEVAALLCVFVGLVLMLRSFWMALVAEISLAVGIGWAFGWATLSVGELNLLSIVFVIALIGIGMDYLVQILVRYRREAQRYVRQDAIWARVFRYVSPPISTACMGAAGAFFVSIFTDFRGAAELGIIAGGGLLLCLLAGYTVLPALLVLFPPRLAPLPTSHRYHTPPRSRRRTAWMLVLPVIWVALLAAGLPLMLRTGFDPNLLSLQAPNLQSVQLIHKLETWYDVVLTRDLSTLRAARDAVEQAPTVGRTDSILMAYDNAQWLQQHQNQIPPIQWATPVDVNPSDLRTLSIRARNLAHAFAQIAGATTATTRPGDSRKAADSLLTLSQHLARGERQPPPDSAQTISRLNLWQQSFIAQLKQLYQQFNPPPLDVAKLPPELRTHYVSADGTYALYVYPRADMDLWQRAPLERFVRDVESRMARVPGTLTVTGIASDIYHTTSSISRSFVRATALALALIVVLVLLDLRSPRQTLVAISVLGLGLPMLLATMSAFGVKWNFANFFALPILIGAGHEYGVFMIHRYREVLHSPRRVWRGFDPSDRALLLCAYVTTSSFGFFWLLGHHKGLRSLGLIMAVGTACIYLATIMVVRPLLIWRLAQRRQPQDAAAPIADEADEP